MVNGYVRVEVFGYLQRSTHGGNQAKVIEVLGLMLN